MRTDNYLKGMVADALAEMLAGEKSKAIGRKHDPTLAGASAPYLHGNGGLFSTPGQEPTVFSTIMTPLQGVANAIPVMPQGAARPDDPAFGGYDSPFFTTFTGVTSEGSVTEPAGICDDQPYGGLPKACTLTAPFGRVGRQFRLDIWNIGHLQHRGEPTDLRLMNNFLDTQTPFQVPSGVGAGAGSDVLKNEFTMRMSIAALNLQRKMCGLTWTGDTSNNTANNGYMEFIGLNSFIAAGNKVDAIDGTPCPSMDSDIKNFGHDLVNGAGRDIVNYMDMLFYYVQWNAQQMGLEPVQWAWAMRPELFDEVVKIWPIRYYQEGLNAIANFANGRLTVTGSETTEFRDAMRNGRFLMVRGQQIPVLLDTCIPEQQGPGGNANLLDGQYASDIYLIPFTVMGGVPVIWWEFFNLANSQAEALANFGGNSNTWTTDAGMFRWIRRMKNGCFEFDFTTMPRIIMRTPYLAGRIQNVAYEPLQHTRQWHPDDTYFVNGGRTSTPQSSVYLETSTTTPVVIGDLS